jgi:signal transduction histidine kinase
MVSKSPDTQNVKVLFEPTDCTVLALPAYLESVISNLVTNGVKYRRQSKGAYVHVRAKENGEFIRVDVEDNGLGIDMNRHGGKIFGMYKTFHGNEDARGIGLFITKNQIESMGGHISVLSELNKGSIFSVFFRNGSTDRTLHH